MQTTPDAAKLILRLSLGVMLLLHGINKLSHGLNGIAGLLESHGLPGFLAYGVLIGEVIAPIMVILGYQARLGAWLIVVNMLFAIGLAHSGEILALNNHGGWAIELQAFYLLTALTIALIGSGRFAIKPGT